VPAERVAAEQRDEGRDGGHRERRAVQRREPACFADVEAIEQDQRRAREHGERDVADEARDVEQRRQSQDHVAAREIDPPFVDGRREHDVAVRVHRALGIARRARRVDHERDVVARERHGARRAALVPSE